MYKISVFKMKELYSLYKILSSFLTTAADEVM